MPALGAWFPHIVKKFEFTLILRSGAELSEDLADALFEAGCDDASPGICNGVVSIDFDREAESLEQAIQSAINQARGAGAEVEKVEIDARTPLAVA